MYDVCVCVVVLSLVGRGGGRDECNGEESEEDSHSRLRPFHPHNHLFPHCQL